MGFTWIGTLFGRIGQDGGIQDGHIGTTRTHAHDGGIRSSSVMR